MQKPTRQSKKQLSAGTEVAKTTSEPSKQTILPKENSEQKRKRRHRTRSKSKSKKAAVAAAAEVEASNGNVAVTGTDSAEMDTT